MKRNILNINIRDTDVYNISDPDFLNISPPSFHAGWSKTNGKYNPQNEMFQRFKTKCSFLQKAL